MYCFLSSSFFFYFYRFSASYNFLLSYFNIFSCFSRSRFYFNCCAYFYRFKAFCFYSSAKATTSTFVLWMALWDWLLRSFRSFLLFFYESFPGVPIFSSCRNSFSSTLVYGSSFIFASVSCLGILGLIGFGICTKVYPSFISTQGVITCKLNKQMFYSKHLLISQSVSS